MPATLTTTGLEIETFEEAFTAIVYARAAGLGLTPEQRQRILTVSRNALGVLCRIDAERDVAGQEALLDVYRTLSWYTEGAHLERIVALLGVFRRPATASAVTLAITAGTPATVIPAGTRLYYNATGSTWQTTAELVLDGAGEGSLSILSETLEAEDEVADADTGWRVLDTVIGFSDVATLTVDEQTAVGAPVETDAALRVRASIEAYRRGQGPLVAIEAAVSQVEGVSFVKAWDNTTDVTDADGIPARNVNVVVDGGAEADVVAAILASRGAGVRMHGTDHEVVTDLGSGRAVTVRYDDVAEIPLWIRATIGTSTSEIPASSEVVAVCAALLLTGAQASAAIGSDVLPRRLAALLDPVDGFDDVTLEISLDGAAWQTTKIPISIRERPVFASARVSVVEA